MAAELVARFTARWPRTFDTPRAILEREVLEELLAIVDVVDVTFEEASAAWHPGPEAGIPAVESRRLTLEVLVSAPTPPRVDAAYAAVRALLARRDVAGIVLTRESVDRLELL